MNIDIVLYVLAAICFLLATFSVSTKNINLTAAGLLLLTLSLLI